MTGTQVDIRLATADDAELLAGLGARTFSDTFGPHNTAEDMAAYLQSAFSPGIQAAEIADARNVFLIAESHGEAFGYVRLRFSEPPSMVPGEYPVEISRFYADRHWIGRGVGAVLMAGCLDLAARRDADVVWLGVWEHNTRAIAFYEKWGFVAVGTQTFQLGSDVQSDLIMALAMTAGK